MNLRDWPMLDKEQKILSIPWYDSPPSCRVD